MSLAERAPFWRVFLVVLVCDKPPWLGPFTGPRRTLLCFFRRVAQTISTSPGSWSFFDFRMDLSLQPSLSFLNAHPLDQPWYVPATLVSANSFMMSSTARLPSLPIHLSRWLPHRWCQWLRLSGMGIHTKHTPYTPHTPSAVIIPITASRPSSCPSFSYSLFQAGSPSVLPANRVMAVILEVE